MAGIFVGRIAELAAIREVVADATNRRSPAAIVVFGDPGIGKSRLLVEALAGERRAEHVEVAGFEAERDVPLAAFRRPLERLTDGEAGGALRRLLEPSPAGTDPLEPIRLFEAVHRALTGRGAVVLSVDDLQWVDDLSLAILHYVIRGTAGAGGPLALVVAARPTTGARAFVDRLGAVLRAPGALRTLELGALDPADGAELARRLAPDSDPAAVKEIATRGRGSPFWIRVLAARGAEDDALATVGRRVGRLDPAAAGLLAHLALIGRPIDGEALAAVAGAAPTRIRALLSGLVDAGVVVTSGPLVRTAHDLIRDAVIRGLPGDVRRRLHRRIAQRLDVEAVDDVSDLREVLEHRRAGGLETAELALRIATSPRRRLLGDDNLRLLGAIADEAPAGDPSSWPVRLRFALAGLAGDAGRHEEAHARWAALVESVPPGDARIRAALEAARIAFHHHDVARIRAWRDRLGRLGRPEPWTDVAIRAFAASVTLWREHSVDEGARLARTALRRARRQAAADGGLERLPTDARRAYLAAIRITYEADVQQERFDRLPGDADEALAVAMDLDPDSIDARVLDGLALRLIGREVASIDVFEQAWREAGRRVLPVQAVTAGNWLARALLDTGRIDEAAAIAEDVAGLADRVGDESLLRGVTHTVRQEIGLLRDDWRAAVANLLA
ncbi:MAG TPA: AAA family ATPase, partial [Candidatus Limnocylindrales bacterium]|nr:AAA family ATPase [Candidatus Limnocylindrales bacterium]